MTHLLRQSSARVATGLLWAALSCGLATSTLSARELVSGNPALTSEMAEQATACMEWLLDTPFTSDQKRKYQQSLANTFRSRDKEAIDNAMAIVNLQSKLTSVSESDRAAVRGKLQAEFLKFLRANPRGESAQLLLSVYDAARIRPTETAPAARPFRTAPALVGKWYTGRVFSTYYRDRLTGSFAPGSGTRFAYEFHADGTYLYTGTLQSTTYNCTSTTFLHETGTYKIEGDMVSTHPDKNTAQQTNTCAPSSNKTAPGRLINANYRFKVYSKDQQTYLDLVNPDGSGVSTYSHEN